MSRFFSTDDHSTLNLGLYLREIKDDSLLTSTEEKDIAGAIALGDRDARLRLIQSNLRLVIKIARGYQRRGMSLDDLIGEGNLGLIRAAEEYDPSFGTRFSTYAAYWIKQAIRSALTNTSSTIRLPAHMVGLLSKWRRAERALAREFGYPPTFEQVAVQLGLTDGQRSLVEHALRAGRLQSESAVGDDDGGRPPYEVSAIFDAPESALEAADRQIELARRLERLDERERALISMRFGLNGQPAMTLKDVGLRLGVTREWVRKLENQAMKKLMSEGEEKTRDETNRSRPRVRRRKCDRLTEVAVVPLVEESASL